MTPGPSLARRPVHALPKSGSGRWTWARRALLLGLVVGLVACGDDAQDSSTSATASSTSASTGGGGMLGVGGGGQGGSGVGGQGGAGGQQAGDLEALLDALRSDLDAAMLAQSRASGWPAAVAGGHLFVSTSALSLVAGEHDNWQGTPMQSDQGFHWVVLPVAAGARYKFTDTSTFEADPWSRAYSYDDFGLMSQLPAAAAHLERHFRVSHAGLAERTVRVWRPSAPATHVIYAHDGQNLFNPDAPWGGWQMQQSTPAGMMVVAVDNTPARMDEYTHVADLIGANAVGGLGDAHGDLVQLRVRPLIAQHYGEPSKVGLIGSSLGGLIALHTAQKFAGEYDFAASLSGTLGWGSIGLSNGAQNETLIERFAAQGHGSTAIYIDSGGNGTCYDSDADGIEDDDPTSSDNYCENKQLEGVLVTAGYSYGVDMWHHHEPGAPHNEAAWALRVAQPLQAFAGQ